MKIRSRICVPPGVVLVALLAVACDESRGPITTASGSISGTVTLHNAADNANVTVSVGGQVVTTGPDGSFKIDSLAAREHTLRAARVGWSTVEEPFTLKDGEHRTLELTLVPANLPPSLTTLTAAPTELRPNGTSTARAAANDPEGDPLTWSWKIDNGFIVTPDAADPSQALITAPDVPNLAATLTVSADDGRGGTVTGYLVVLTRPNTRPILNSLTAAPQLVSKSGVVTLSASAGDIDDDALTYTWTVPQGWTLTPAPGGGAPDTAVVTVTAPNEPSRYDTITVTVADSRGAEVTGSVIVSTQVNREPQLATLSAFPGTVARGDTIQLDAAASDADGDSLSYEWSVTPDTWTLPSVVAGGSVTLIAPNTYGDSALVSVIIRDGFGGEVRGNVVVQTAADRAPTINSIPSSALPVAGRAVWSYQVAATDAENDPIAFSLGASAPSWASLSTSGLLRMSPPIDAAAESYGYEVIASDGVLTASQYLSGTVAPFALRNFAAAQMPWSQDTSVADLNGDGRPDVVTGHYSGYITVTFGTPLGFTAAASTTGTENLHQRCGPHAVGDIDGDGDLDVVTSCTESRPDATAPWIQGLTLIPWFNDGTGQFTLGQRTQLTTQYAQSHNWLTLTDLDGDGRADAVTQLSDTIGIWLATASGTFVFHTGYTFPGDYNLISAKVRVAKMSADPHPDLIVQLFAHRGTHFDAVVTVLPTDGSGNLLLAQEQRSVPLLQARFDASAFGDFDEDGDNDLVLSESGSQNLRLYSYDETTGFTFTRNLTSARAHYQHPLAVGDLDSDGHLDFVVPDYSKGQATAVHFGDGAGGFPHVRFIATDPGGFGTYEALIADWNGDGADDLIWRNSNQAIGVSY